MRFTLLTFLIFTLNGALDSGRYDDISMAAAKEEVQTGDVFAWLERTIEDIDLSLFEESDRRQIQEALLDAAGGLDGRELRKMWVENRGLCYLLGLVTEVLQRNFNPRSGSV